MKPKGTGILFVNNKREVLLFLRDDKTSIPYPNCWDILGGHPEGNETPEDCIRREMLEEIEIDIKTPKLFKVFDMAEREEYIFWDKVDWDINKIVLHEGQKLHWFTRDDVGIMPDGHIAFGFKNVILDFFKATPF